jgi:hypothetical protein
MVKSTAKQGKKKSGTVVQVTTKEIIDYNTGEVMQSEDTKTIQRYVEKDQFMRVYTKEIGGIVGLNAPLAYKCLFYLWSIAEYQTNRITILARHRQEMKELFAVKSHQSIYNAITLLVKSGLLLKDTKFRQEYVLNPKYFFYGSELERLQAVKLVLQYNFTENDGQEV